MQLKKMLSIVLLFVSFNCFSQNSTLETFNQQKNQINRKGMLVLGSWALGNVAYGAIAGANATGSDRYFHQMNVIWGGINLGLSTLGYIGSKKRAMLNTGETLRQQSLVEKTFLFNAGLDVAYMVGGAYLKERANNKPSESDRLKGFGNSIILQGGALLLFDGVMYILHSRHGKNLYNQSGLQLTTTANGIGLVLPL